MTPLDPGEFRSTAIRRLVTGTGPRAQRDNGRVKAGFAFLPREILRAAGTAFLTSVSDMSGHVRSSSCNRV